jgi:hypothetical protein
MQFYHIFVSALSSRRFQHGFHRFNLHRPTLTPDCSAAITTAPSGTRTVTSRTPSARSDRPTGLSDPAASTSTVNVALKGA